MIRAPMTLMVATPVGKPCSSDTLPLTTTMGTYAVFTLSQQSLLTHLIQTERLANTSKHVSLETSQT